MNARSRTWANIPLPAPIRLPNRQSVSKRILTHSRPNLHSWGKVEGFTMKLTLISLEETQEQEDERIHADEDEQTWRNAALQDIPEERQSKGWYDEKPQDLVSIFRSKTNRMEYLDEQDDYT